MKLLLDTHIWFWVNDDPVRLGRSCRDLIADPSNALYWSTVTTLELARLTEQGRLDVGKDLRVWIETGMEAVMANAMEIDDPVALEAYRLPGTFHKDPCDRLLVAQARIHDLYLVTMDDMILNYPHVRTLDARV
ncbi:MAG TPA: type II toxin-antitoxin system VapC family toxin [Kiritimatiellia bacterium]|nr:type II toxin-antitoxin system VapC family toxin [Kiritimatiellia bacterium]